MRRAPLTLLLAAIGCTHASAPAPASTPSAAPASQRAIAAARRCIEQRPQEFTSVRGSPLLLDEATVAPQGDDRWDVYFPEQETDGKPVGLDVRVDLGTGECTQLKLK